VRVLGPDDYTTNRLVTITSGPFEEVASPFPLGVFGHDRETAKVEDKSLHGRVFRIVTFDGSWLILEPLDGIAEAPQVRHIGKMVILPHDGRYVPSGIKLNIKGVEVSEVSAEYVIAFKKHFCPPADMPKQSAPGKPIEDLFGKPEHVCDNCEKKGQLPG